MPRAKPGNGDAVFAQVATLQSLLEGVDLPADKQRLIRYAHEQGAGSGFTHLLERLPDREYSSLDEVGEALAPVQPAASAGKRPPREESDLPPGGDEYVRPHPTPGAVRDDAPPENPPQKAIEQQTKTQKKQQQRQEDELGA